MPDEIFIKRVYEPVETEDGTRLLVDRIWPRGISKSNARITAWLKEIAPSAELRKWFDHDVERWDEFCRRYHAELALNPPGLAEIRRLARAGIVTLVYAAHDREHNNAVALRTFLAKLDPN